jgi:hypothetical protein
MLSAEFAEITEQLLETLWRWKIETDNDDKDKLWQQLVVLHEMHCEGFKRISDHMEAQIEEAQLIREATIKRHAVRRDSKPE